jgi:rare lipoprotein A
VITSQAALRSLAWPVYFFSFVLLIAGCAAPQKEAPVQRPAGSYKIGKPYQVAGVWYYPREQPDYDETGLASWYGPGFHGKQTANGEIYDMNALTAAHKTLPMPVRVRVTNLQNGRSIVLRINDRGPFVNGRIIDVSRRGAQLLGFEGPGTAAVRVQILDGGRPGAFIAEKPHTLEEERQMAAAPQSEVSSQVLPGSVASPTRKEGASSGAKAPPVVIGAAPSDEEGILKEPENVEIQPVPAATNIYIQVGAFRERMNAERLRTRLLTTDPGFNISMALVEGKEFFRVRKGPISSVEVADAVLAKVISAGHTTARIVIN